MKKYEAYKDSGVEWIGRIPEGWNVKRIKHLFTFGRGLNITKADLVEKGLPVISYGQIHSKENTGTHISDNLLRFIPEDLTENKQECKVNSGDFIFADTSEDKEGCGNCIYVDRDDVFAGYHSLVLKGKGEDNKYFAYLFKSDYWRSQIRAKASGVKVFSITQSLMSDSSVLVPSASEQQAIASYLDHKVGQIDASVSAINTQIEDLKAYRQSVISEAVTKGLNPNVPMKDSGIEWIGEIPKGWSVVPLKHYLSLKGRIGWKGLKSEEFQEKSYAYLVTGQDFNSDIVNWEKCYQINKERYDEDPFIQLENGDLLVTKDGTIGKVAKVVNLDKPACLNSGIFVVKQTKGVFEQNYLYWVLVSNQLKEFVGFNSTGSTIAHLYQNVFENMPLTVPSLTEQQAIASYLDSKTSQIDTAIASLEAQRADLNALKQSIISEAVTGKIDVRDWKPIKC